MLYTVECSYTHPESEDEWNGFYSKEKLPALVSVTGFSTSQRFKALTPGCPVYLAIHNISSADIIASKEYRQKGGGSFARWQPHITDWHRNLYECAEAFPAVSSDQILLLSTEPLGFIETELGYRVLEMLASGLEKLPPRRVAYVLPRENAAQIAEISGAYFYEAITAQLQTPRL
ncbi:MULTISPECIES: sugar ABC transporter [unclassified Cedecea]|uniref:sugar ABC transporter n=1 Tax=unclassified Cedecea TaxID=2649846 RepID=UPI003018BF41